MMESKKHTLDDLTPDEVIAVFSDTRLKARRLIMLDRAFSTLNAAKTNPDTVERALACIELAKEIRLGTNREEK